MVKSDVSHLPYESAFVPEIITEDHRIKFACHPGVMADEVMGDNKLAEKAEAANKDQEK
ncbi:MAG: hypothetical protein KZQ64_04820 [gamma proteobacterium symbiont of Bathyaustriella thionipta]|nr:hypothetical protein [gamma proteobacterium symbiont of Bathyaustriella thionipta]MCU7951222.1 hypothetical protein [gamma proteobacterium symbiont of Bathyaustriella thionipta]MCU7952700.1 hypothetical protein [gamma proteobacterium symbiont of Bathyaustriella thionipta]MCU7957743.1 hypothetical protein [gamma proteobacterium symbiont of Bathyaustriella thionipta]MCU7968055.1 hypothetical protein [gamma proteobacterium symbiont of Bathyaustriella thionipta]